LSDTGVRVVGTAINVFCRAGLNVVGSRASSGLPSLTVVGIALLAFSGESSSRS
jgi:hypothetical protein